MAILGSFRLLSLAECLDKTLTFSSLFLIALIPVSIIVSFGSLSTADVHDTDDV